MATAGNRIQGILGMDCLRHYCFQLDFVANKIRFLDREHLKEQELGQAYRLRLTSANITIQGTFVEATNAPIGIDTAAYDDGSLGAKLFQKAVRKQDYIFIKEWNNSSGTRTREARFRQGVFGDEVFSDLVLMECPSGENFLGLRFLARHLATFDFPGRTVYLKRMRTDPLR